jgi:hypothetical protein
MCYNFEGRTDRHVGGLDVDRDWSKNRMDNAENVRLRKKKIWGETRVSIVDVLSLKDCWTFKWKSWATVNVNDSGALLWLKM